MALSGLFSSTMALSYGALYVWPCPCTGLSVLISPRGLAARWLLASQSGRSYPRGVPPVAVALCWRPCGLAPAGAVDVRASERGFSFWVLDQPLGAFLLPCSLLPGTFRALHDSVCVNYLCFIQIQRPQAMSAQATCGPPTIRLPPLQSQSPLPYPPNTKPLPA